MSRPWPTGGCCAKRKKCGSCSSSGCWSDGGRLAVRDTGCFNSVVFYENIMNYFW